MKKFIGIIILGLLIMPFTAPVYAEVQFYMSPMEIREMQTRVFNTSDTNKVYKAAINTLQDNDFSIQNIEDEVGFILAQKENKEKRANKGTVAVYSTTMALNVVSAALGGSGYNGITDSGMRLNNELAARTIVTVANVNVEPFGKKQTKVRVTFIERELQNADGYSYVKSAPRKINRITSPEVYKEFFRQLDKSIFYENSGI